MLRLHKLSMLSVIDGDPELILSEIVDAAIALSGADFGNIQLIDPASLALRIVAQRGLPQMWVDFWNSVPEGQGSCNVSLQRGERVIVENVEQSPIFEGAALEMQLKGGVRAVQSTPLVSRSGKPLGVFSTHYSKPQGRMRARSESWTFLPAKLPISSNTSRRLRPCARARSASVPWLTEFR